MGREAPPTPEDSGSWRRELEATTLAHEVEVRDEVEAPRLALTVLCHPDPRRIGEVAPLHALDSGHPVEISRLSPRFSIPGEGPARPLADAHLSRQPITLRPTAAGGVELLPGGSALEVEGQPVTEPVTFESQALDRGAVLLLAQRVALVLHRQHPPFATSGPRLGLVGESDAIRRLRAEILAFAPHRQPVLLRGESGSGKELVAAALHSASGRADGPLVSVNVGAIPTSLAAAELFGTRRGAFTGASESNPGYFRRSDGGTLFLDEIGEAPAEIQVALLRTLETGEVQPVGGGADRSVTVRVVAATDADLESAVDAGTFRAPLYHRLATHEIRMPPLRERRDDLGRLLIHFLRQELADLEAEDRLDPRPSSQRPWLSAPWVAELARQPWPGNVRQLRNLARALAATYHAKDQADPDERFRRRWCQEPMEAEISPTPRDDPPPRRRPSEIDRETLVAVLRRHRWSLRPTARDLGISRTSLYLVLDRFPDIRRAGELEREELVEGLERHGSPEALAEALEVSLQGLRQRLRTLGLD